MCLEACGSNDLASQFSETFPYIGNPDVNSVYRERWLTAGVARQENVIRGGTHLRFNHAYQTSHFSGNFFRGLPDILWAPIQSSARDGKEEEMWYAAPLLLFNWDSILNLKCSWFYIFLTLRQFWHAASAEWQRGRGKVPGFGLTVVLIASCSLFHVLPWGGK